MNTSVLTEPPVARHAPLGVDASHGVAAQPVGAGTAAQKPATAQPIKIAILAMGGEGGGVLADWIVALGEHNGFVAQTTSVPGVAQRTGATIYYVELYPQALAEADGGTPVLALMPLPGDVDVVLASELMEAGRAVQRGLVTPGRTTLIASTHRVYAIAEKIALGDGRVDSEQLLSQSGAAARRFVRFDMAEAAQRTGSVISAVLFGALAGTGVLPFSRAQFEQTIERGGVGVQASLRAFADAFERAQASDGGQADAAAAVSPGTPSSKVSPLDALQARDPEVHALLERIRAGFPRSAHAMLIEGVRRTIDYQDPAYAALYLDRMAALLAQPGGATAPLVDETARHLALWMSYEDTIRVAALKTRATRFDRVRGEVGLKDDQVVSISEYMHPRLQEIVETLPGFLGRWLQRSGWARALVSRFTQKGRVVRTSSLHGFLMLYAVASLRRWRRSTLRYEAENAAIERWLALIAQVAAANPELAVEVARCQRLVKGYSDTYERGVHNFKLLMAAIERGGAQLAPATLREWRDAALADEEGGQLRALLERQQPG